MRKFFLISLLTLVCSVMAFAEGHASYQEGDVAQITIGGETSYYETLSDLQTAIAALPTDGTVATIKLLDHIDGGELQNNQTVFTILANVKVELDLNGKALSAKLITGGDNYWLKQVINNSGDLTINDSQNGGKIMNSITSGNSSDCTRLIQNNAGAKMHLVKCIIENDKMGVDNRGGELVIEEGVTINVSENSNTSEAAMT